MPGTATTTARHPHFAKHHRTSSKLSAQSRNTSATKLQAGHVGAGHNLTLTALKGHGNPMKRTESATSVHSDHTAVSRTNGHTRPALVTRKSKEAEQPKKPKFVMPDEVLDGDEEEDDEDQWVSSGVVTPDDREPQQPSLPPGLNAAALPVEYAPLPNPEPPSPVAGPSSVPIFDSVVHNAHRQTTDGRKTAPPSRPPSIIAIRSSRPFSMHGPPSLIRTSSFTPNKITAPPLTTPSIANAEITSTNGPEGSPPMSSPGVAVTSTWAPFTPIHSSPPTSPRLTNGSGASQILRRASVSSTRSSATISSPFFPRERKTSTFSTVSMNATGKRASAALTSLSSIPNARTTPPPLVSHFPPRPLGRRRMKPLLSSPHRTWLPIWPLGPSTVPYKMRIRASFWTDPSYHDDPTNDCLGYAQQRSRTPPHRHSYRLFSFHFSSAAGLCIIGIIGRIGCLCRCILHSRISSVAEIVRMVV
ncbi:hypothetical protein BS47DRAFT_779344 [Hydnum rufescens UP504]|uniref:Uncharacterized protein n=1 Tax=Hydnum rufescens UP504 TaxID=1448309 RepID=A0A9P6B1X0_9AGAM|nr:hypothetical protein BS47DRAFT_779344 [Hydnum rufescens UP504]